MIVVLHRDNQDDINHQHGSGEAMSGQAVASIDLIRQKIYRIDNVREGRLIKDDSRNNVDD